MKNNTQMFNQTFIRYKYDISTKLVNLGGLKKSSISLPNSV